MKIKAFIGLAGVGAALLPCATASGWYTGLTVIKHATVNVGGGLKWVYRIYANFSDPNDHLVSVVGFLTTGDMVIQSRNATDTGPGSNFFNPGGTSSKTAPFLEELDFNPDLQWGTFATIGVAIANQGSGQSPEFSPDQTGTSLGFPNFIGGNSLVSNNIGWFTPGPVEQGRAGYLGDGDTQLRVLMMQLTVNAGDFVKGTVSISGTNWNGSGNTAFVANGQTFSPPIPAPAALGLLALAGVCGSRPRRRA